MTLIDRKIDFNSFHNLIEIAENMRKAIQLNKEFSTPKRKMVITYHQNQVIKWLELNYDKSGIDKEVEEILLS